MEAHFLLERFLLPGLILGLLGQTDLGPHCLPFGKHSKYESCLTLQLLVKKIAEFANSIDLDEMAHHEPSHQNLHCLLSSL